MRATAFVSALVLTCGPASAQTPIRTSPEACAQLAQLQVAGVALTVIKAAWFEAGAPMPGGRAGAPPRPHSCRHTAASTASSIAARAPPGPPTASASPSRCRRTGTAVSCFKAAAA